MIERAQKESEKSDYDQIWVVFDKDDFPATNFDNAVNMAIAKKMSPAYSNQSFEYWLLLHFEDHQGGAMHRAQYGTKIKQHLANYPRIHFDFDGNKHISSEFFQIMMDYDEQKGKKRIDLAIERAEKIMAFHTGNPPSASESSTTVFRLINEMLKFT